jgi:hypothetical protein
VRRSPSVTQAHDRVRRDQEELNCQIGQRVHADQADHQQAAAGCQQPEDAGRGVMKVEMVQHGHHRDQVNLTVIGCGELPEAAPADGDPWVMARRAFVAAAAVAVPLAVSAGGTAPGGPAPGGPGPASGRAGQTVRLAGYAITLPAGFRVRQSSPTQASATLRGATVRFTLQVPAAPPPPGAREVTVGGLGTCWYLRTPADQILDEISNTRWPDGWKRTALVITATGMSRQQLFQLVEHQAITAGTPVPAGG